MNPLPPFSRGLVTIVLPAKDEEVGIREILRDLPRAQLHASGLLTEVLVLDGHSNDRTRDVVYEQGDATVIFDREHGKGRAFINARPHFRGEYVVMMDADGTYPATAVPRLLAPLASGNADVVMGIRRPREGSMTGSHRIGNAILSTLASVMYVRPCPDVCTGMWAFRQDHLARMPLRSSRFELEVELFAIAARQGLRVEQVPVDYLPRRGAPKLRARDAFRIGWRLALSRVVSLESSLVTSSPHALSTQRKDRFP